MKQIKILILLIFILALLGSSYAWFFVWNKPQQNVKSATAIPVQATVLFSEYSSNEKNANTKYIDKIVEVSGKVSTVSKNSEGKTVVLLQTDDLMFGVNCTMEEDVEIKEGEAVSLKGICTGYLTDVVLIRCYKTK
jgi:tRNA_anti-like